VCREKKTKDEAKDLAGTEKGPDRQVKKSSSGSESEEREFDFTESIFKNSEAAEAKKG
jgi:hypothetical protein